MSYFSYYTTVSVLLAGALLLVVTKIYKGSFWFAIWPLNILSHRRTLRVLEATVASVNSIAEAATEHGNKHHKLLEAEVNGVLDTLTKELQLFRPDISVSARRQWEIIEHENKVSDPSFSRANGVKALHRSLEAQYRTVIASAPLFYPTGPRSTSSEPTFDKEASNPDVAEALKPDEAALLATLTEKFYGSAVFKFIGGALVAAALLAGAGSVYLGSHTMTLLESLEKAEAKGKSDINASAQRIQDSIAVQSTLLKGAGDMVAAKQEDFKTLITKAEKDINTIVIDFNAKSGNLRKEAIEAAIVTLESELNDPVSTLSQKIGEEVRKASDNMNTLTRALEDLERRKIRISEEMGRLEKEIPQADNLIRKLNDINARDEELSRAVQAAKMGAEDAVKYVKAAKQSASLAESARAAVVSAVEKAAMIVGDQQFDLGIIKSRIETLNKSIYQTESELGNTGAVARDHIPLTKQVSALASQVDQMKAQLQKLEQLPKPSARAFPQSEVKLSRPQWIEIQQNLAAWGVSPGKIDGLPGKNTRKAIRQFQRATSQAETGTLTARQIKLLLTPP